ncbi:MAG: alpha/beta hydrolase [Ignavibacteria bacterium]
MTAENIVKKESIIIKNKHGDSICIDLRYIKSDSIKPLVILCHGFKGFKDWGCFPYLMDRIAAEGNFAVSFNFSYNGTGEDEGDQNQFSRLDLFAKNTFSRELDDLGCVIDHLIDHKNDHKYDTDNVTLIGHSRGGGIAILKTAEDARINNLIVLSSVNSFNRYSDVLKSKWKEAGYFEVLNSRTNQMMKMDYTLVEDLEKNSDRLNIQKAIGKINVTTMIIHGTQDVTVDYSNGEDLYSRSNKEKTELFLIENTGHTFGAVHPFTGTTVALEKVITLIMNFLKK